MKKGRHPVTRDFLGKAWPLDATKAQFMLQGREESKAATAATGRASLSGPPAITDVFLQAATESGAVDVDLFDGDDGGGDVDVDLFDFDEGDMWGTGDLDNPF